MGIHARIMVSALVLIIATALTMDMLAVSITKSFMRSRFEDRIAFLSRYLALNAEVGVLINDTHGLERLAVNLLREKDVAQIKILDAQNNALVDLKRDVAAASLSWVESPIVMRRVYDETLIFSPGRSGKFDHHNLPAMDRIGTVRIQFTTHGIDQIIEVISQKYILFSAGFALFAIIVFFFVSRSIVENVYRLADTARRVEQGDLKLRAKPGNLPEINQLALALNAMLDYLERNREALKRANQEMLRQKMLAERGKFSMMIAHEVKNPLSIIKSSLDVLQKECNIPADNLMVDYIEDEVKRLNNLIEGFLSFARPVNPTFRLVDLNDLVKHLVARFELQHMGNSLRIECNYSVPNVEIEADGDLLARAIGNIVKNAVEANGENGVVHINTDIDADNWRLVIRDEGEGIPQELLTEIFEPFFTTRAKGTGLGLAFAKEVISTHGGSIAAENGVTGGAMFYITLPLKKMHAVWGEA